MRRHIPVFCYHIFFMCSNFFIVCERLNHGAIYSMIKKYEIWQWIFKQFSCFSYRICHLFHMVLLHLTHFIHIFQTICQIIWEGERVLSKACDCWYMNQQQLSFIIKLIFPVFIKDLLNKNSPLCTLYVPGYSV